jgi:hypothetical protein
VLALLVDLQPGLERMTAAMRAGGRGELELGEREAVALGLPAAIAGPQDHHRPGLIRPHTSRRRR